MRTANTPDTFGETPPKGPDFEPSRTGLEIVGELASQMSDVLKGLPPELMGRARDLLEGMLPTKEVSSKE